MNIQTSFVVAALLALAACTTTSSAPAPATSGVAATGTGNAMASGAGTPEPGAPAASSTGTSSGGASGSVAPGATAACTDKQFVACESGEACATRQGKLVNPKPCFEHAADACAALSCAHGCNIHHGTPRQILCALNASGSSHMKRCAGYSNWACPEKMRCDGVDPNVDDAMGTCVPES